MLKFILFSLKVNKPLPLVPETVTYKLPHVLPLPDWQTIKVELPLASPYKFIVFPEIEAETTLGLLFEEI